MVTLDGLYAGWMVLNDLMGELRREGVDIPSITHADFRNSKMVLEYLRSFNDDIRRQENADLQLRQDMENKILSLRETLLAWAENANGVEYRKKWEGKFEDALHGLIDLPTVEPMTSISDLPREKDVSFFRIKLPEDIPVETVGAVAEDCGVLIQLDGKRHLQVSGEKTCVRKAMKTLGELFYGENRLE